MPRDSGVTSSKQQDALHVAAEHAALDGRADRDALVRVDALEALFADEGLDHVLHGGDTAGAADKQHLADLARVQSGVGERLLHGADGLLDQVVRQLVELRARERHVQVLRAGGVRRDIRQVDVRGGHAGKLDLRLLGRLAQTLHGDLVKAEVDAVGLLEFLDQIFHDARVKIVAAEAVVARRGQHFDDAVADLEHGHVEGAAAEVVDHDLLIAFLIETVGEGRGRRLVDDALDVQARDLARILGRLTLCVGEVGRDGDDGLGHALAQVGLGVGFELLQHHRGDLLRGVVLVVDRHLVVRAHLTLDRGDRAVGVGDGLALGHLADHTLAVLGKSDDRRRGARALGVRDNDSLAAFHDGHAAVGGSQVNTDDLSHDEFLLYSNQYN